MTQTAVEWLEEQIKDIFYIAEASEMTKKFKSVYDRAKEMEKEQKGYSEEEVKDMLFEALNKKQEQCCITNTKDSIVREVLKQFKNK